MLTDEEIYELLMTAGIRGVEKNPFLAIRVYRFTEQHLSPKASDDKKTLFPSF